MRMHYGASWNKVALPLSILLWFKVGAAAAVIALLAWAFLAR